MEHNKEEMDEKLRTLIAKKLPRAKENEWFTRKVQNRLPARRSGIRSASFIVKALGYAAAAGVCIGMWVWLYMDTAGATISVINCVRYVLLSLVTVGLAALAAYHAVLRD